jgi:hypothetical protein
VTTAPEGIVKRRPRATRKWRTDTDDGGPESTKSMTSSFSPSGGGRNRGGRGHDYRAECHKRRTGADTDTRGIPHRGLPAIVRHISPNVYRSIKIDLYFEGAEMRFRTTPWWNPS